jgi:hypothetical protein
MQTMLGRNPLPGAAEELFISDTEDASAPVAELTSRGYSVRFVNAKELADRYGVRGVPLFIAVSPEGRIVYAGGAGFRGDQDAVIWDQLRRSENPSRLPVLGCAMGSTLRGLADPFGWKYIKK